MTRRRITAMYLAGLAAAFLLSAFAAMCAAGGISTPVKHATLPFWPQMVTPSIVFGSIAVLVVTAIALVAK